MALNYPRMNTSNEAIDQLIELIAEAHEEVPSALQELASEKGEKFNEACNAVGIRVARRFIAGDLDFGDADYVMNWVWFHIVMNWDGVEGSLSIPQPAFDIYEAFDAGEWNHGEPDVDPVKKYTIPELADILANLPEGGA